MSIRSRLNRLERRGTNDAPVIILNQTEHTRALATLGDALLVMAQFAWPQRQRHEHDVNLVKRLAASILAAWQVWHNGQSQAT